MRIAILDDYLGVSQSLADWSHAGDVTVFGERIAPEALAQTLRTFDIVCSMRERTAFPRDLLLKLPNLKLLTITGAKHRTLDMEAATELGVVVCGTSRRGTGHHATPELAWGLILSLARHIPQEVAKMRSGGWQSTLGTVLSGKTLGLIGLGRLGSRMVPIGRAFEMEVLAWSQNLSEEHAASLGAARVDKDELLARADVVSLHVVLSERTRGIVSAREFVLMKPTALLVNTARAQLVDRTALLDALRTRRIAGAALDVFDVEPLPDDDELRKLPNAILTPHLGYTVEDLLRVFYEDTVENVTAFQAGAPVRVLNPEVLER